MEHRQLVQGDDRTYNYYAVDEDGAGELYEELKLFWSERASQTPQEWQKHVADYRKSKGKGYEPVRDKLAELFEAAGGVETFTLLDLGGASGSILYEMNGRLPVRKLTYLNVEPFEPFVIDCQRMFGQSSAIKGDAEGFADMPDDAFPDAPYSVFFSSLVFCMINPAAARRTLHRACQLADDIVLFDSIANADGSLSSTETVVFDYLAEGRQFYFAHHFAAYLESDGFDLVATEPVTLDHIQMKRGWGLIHARRR